MANRPANIIECRCGTRIAIAPHGWAVIRWPGRGELVRDGYVGVWCPNLDCRRKAELGPIEHREAA